MTMQIIQITELHPNDAFSSSKYQLEGSIFCITDKTAVRPSMEVGFTYLSNLEIVKAAIDLDKVCFYAVKYKILFAGAKK